MMLATHKLAALVLVLAFATACDTRPTPEIEAARGSGMRPKPETFSRRSSAWSRYVALQAAIGKHGR